MASDVNDETIESVVSKLNLVASLISSVRTVLLSRAPSGDFDERDAVMVAALEKAGALCDSQSMRLRGPSAAHVGGPDQWVALEED